MNKKTLAPIFVLAFAVMASQSAKAEVVTWNCTGTNYWHLGSCWSTSNLPTSSDYVTISPVGGDTNVVLGSSITGAADWLVINSDSSDFIGFQQIGGSLTVTNTQYVGSTGSGAFAISGGSNTVNELVLGTTSSSNGTYDLSGAGSLSAGLEIIGSLGNGTFTQSGGTNAVGESLNLGNGTTGTGSYSLSAGNLSVGNYETIGAYGGTGTFTQSGGSNMVGSFLSVNGGSNYVLSGTGNVSVGDIEYIGSVGTATFTQSGGINTVTHELYLGGNSAGNGNYNLSAGDLSANLDIIGEYGIGTFTQTGGTNTVGQYLYLGEMSGSTGTYNLNGGILNVSSFLNGAGTGTLNINGGTLTGGIFGSYVDVDNLVLGSTAGSSGSHNLSGFDSLSAGTEAIGESGNGTLTQSGGSNTVSDTMTIAANPGSAGTYNLSGGTLVAGSITNNDTFNYSGGNLNANITNNADFNLSGGGTRTVTGDVTNTATGTVKTTGTIADFTGTFTNNGAFISDPSTNSFTDLIIGASGYLNGGVGDSFIIANDFINNSTNTLWDTNNAQLIFDTGTDTLHTFTLGGLASTDQFSWGALELIGGNTLDLSGSSFYVDTLTLELSSVLNLDGITIYYRHLQNNGGQFNLLNGAQLADWITPPISPVPEPETWAMLLIGLGLIGFIATRRKNQSNTMNFA